MHHPDPEMPLSRWTPELLDRPGATYGVICDVLGEAITAGELAPGTRLPSHRDLARRLGVAVGTVTRAYKEALRRGLVRGDVGRGTFVRERPPDPPGMRHYPHPDRPLLDLYKNHPLPVPTIEGPAWSDALSTLAARDDLVELMDTAWSFQVPRSSEVGARWIRHLGFAEASAERVVDCPGLQSAIAAALATFTSPGDVLATAELTFPVVSSLAERHGLSVHGLEIDGDGILPEAFEDLCRHARPKALYLEPDLHAPTTAVLPMARRRRLAELAREHGVWIVEFSSLGALLDPRPPSLASLAPDRTIALVDVCHALSVGLRSVYALAPSGHEEALLTAAASVAGTTPMLTAKIVGHWIEYGVADRLLAARRDELARRHALAVERFERIGLGPDSTDGRLRGHPAAHNLWLELPATWNAPGFVATAERRGVAVTDGAWFAVGDRSPTAVRLCLGNLPNREQLADALDILVDLVDEPNAGRRAPAL